MEVGKRLVLIFVVLFISSSLLPTSVFAGKEVQGDESSFNISDDNDILAVSVEIVSPVEGEVIETPDVEVEWQSEDADWHEIRINGGEWEYPPSGETSYTFENLENGNHTVDVVAASETEDNKMDTVNFTVDAPHPSMEITSPDEGEVFDIPEVTVQWVSQEVSYHEVKLNDGDWINVGPDTSYTFENLAEGEYTAYAKGVYDEEINATDNVSFEVDIDMPEVNIYAPEEGEIFGVDEVTVEWEYNNTDRHEVRLNDEDWIDVGVETSYTFDELEDDEHRVEVRGGDDYFQDTDQVTFTVDTVDPVLDIKSPDEDDILESNSVRVVWETSNEPTEIVEQRIRIDGGIWDTPTLDKQYEFSEVEDGEHEVEIEATDEAGNTGGTSVSFIVDTMSPELEIISPGEDGKLFEVDEVTVRWRGQDSGIGIQRYQVKIEYKDWIEVGRKTEHSFTDLIDGEYTVWVRAWDRINNTQTKEISFQIDTIEEDVNIEITEPRDDARVEGPDLTVKWTSEKAEYHEVRINGGRWINVGNSTEYTFTNLSAEEYTIEVRATDQAGWRRTDEANILIKEEGQTISVSLYGVPYLIWILMIVVLVNVVLVSYFSFFRE
ncbi:MAG: hypothetical protein V5A88_06190 [Candidatus Thermoplasmatota archaeon]